MNDITANLTLIRARISEACAKAGRGPEQVRLIAVSKVKPANMVEAAFRAGQELFGENYVQEFQQKADQVSSPVCWHFIGALQSNKVKYLRGRVAMIHSVDRLSLAREIDRQWAKIDRNVDILLQVNIGDESSKSGCAPEELAQLAGAISHLQQVRIRGLMCLPPHSDNPEEVRPYFRRMRQLAEQVSHLGLPGVEMAELSMGMSDDFPVAIEEGATLVRIGTAIFGARVRP